MYAQLRSLRLIAVVILAVVFLAGCGRGTSRGTGTTGRSSGGAKSGSREVKFALDGGGGIWAQQDSATVNFSEGKVVVEKARVLLNDKEVAQLPENAKVVAIDYTAGMLTITADGTRIHETRFQK